MVLYGITPEPLAEELRYADPTLLFPFYSNDLVFNGSARRSASQLHLLMDRGAGPGLLPQYRQSLFISDNPEEEESARQEFEWTGLHINYGD